MTCILEKCDLSVILFKNSQLTACIAGFENTSLIQIQEEEKNLTAHMVSRLVEMLFLCMMVMEVMKVIFKKVMCPITRERCFVIGITKIPQPESPHLKRHKYGVSLSYLLTVSPFDSLH